MNILFSRRLRSLLFLVFILQYTLTIYSQILSTEKIYQKAVPSIASLTVQKSNDDVILGTAFLIKSNGLAVTCFHVINDAKLVKAKFSDGQEFLASGIVDKDEKRDIALIKIKCFKETVLNLSKDEPKIGSTASIIGSPKGLEFSISDGIISQIQTFEGIKEYQFTCPASPGNSGSPLFNSKGEVIGVVSWQIREGQNLNFAIPTSYILGLDQSLPTTPWTNVVYDTENIEKTPSNMESLKLLASLYEAMKDNSTSNIEIENKMIIVRNGFQKTIPPEFYSSTMRINSILDKFKNLSIQDDTLNIIIERMISAAQLIIKGSDIIREAISTAKYNNGWNDKAKDLLSQAAAIFQLAEYDPFRDSFIKPYLSKLDGFLFNLTEDDKAEFDGRNDSLGFTLGVYNYTNNPTQIIDIDENGLARYLGLSHYDEIQSVNSINVKSLYDIKKTIYDNRGNYIRFEILHDGDKKTFDRKIPSDLTPFKN